MDVVAFARRHDHVSGGALEWLNETMLAICGGYGREARNSAGDRTEIVSALKSTAFRVRVEYVSRRGTSRKQASGAAASLEPVFADLVEQRPGRQFEELGGARLVAARALEGEADEAAFEDLAVLLDGQLVLGELAAVEDGDG